MTILEVMRFVGRGAHAQLKFGNRKPGSSLPLLFEITEKHLKDCERKEDKSYKYSLVTDKYVNFGIMRFYAFYICCDIRQTW